jgi:hypothetical protein
VDEDATYGTLSPLLLDCAAAKESLAILGMPRSVEMGAVSPTTGGKPNRSLLTLDLPLFSSSTAVNRRWPIAFLPFPL